MASSSSVEWIPTQGALRSLLDKDVGEQYHHTSVDCMYRLGCPASWTHDAWFRMLKQLETSMERHRELFSDKCAVDNMVVSELEKQSRRICSQVSAAKDADKFCVPIGFCVAFDKSVDDHGRELLRARKIRQKEVPQPTPAEGSPSSPLPPLTAVEPLGDIDDLLAGDRCEWEGQAVEDDFMTVSEEVLRELPPEAHPSMRRHVPLIRQRPSLRKLSRTVAVTTTSESAASTVQARPQNVGGCLPKAQQPPTGADPKGRADLSRDSVGAPKCTPTPAAVPETKQQPPAFLVTTSPVTQSISCSSG